MNHIDIFFFGKYSKSKFLKTRQVAAELFNADRQTDGQTVRNDEVNSRFSQFCERAKK